MTIDELDPYINGKIQGVFGKLEMGVLKEEIEKLRSGDIYVEIGTDEGRSARVAHEYAKEGVYKIFIDINDPDPRGKFMQDEGMVGLGKRGFWIHGDADEFSELFLPDVKLLYIDAHHDYESVKKNTLLWEKNVSDDGVILFHDYDHLETKRWLDERYGDNKEVIGGKIVRVCK